MGSMSPLNRKLLTDLEIAPPFDDKIYRAACAHGLYGLRRLTAHRPVKRWYELSSTAHKYWLDRADSQIRRWLASEEPQWKPLYTFRRARKPRRGHKKR